MINEDLYTLKNSDFSYERLQLTIKKAQVHLDDEEPDAALTLLDNADRMMKKFTNNYSSVTKEQQVVIDKLAAMRKHADDLIDDRFPDLVMTN